MENANGPDSIIPKAELSQAAPVELESFEAAARSSGAQVDQLIPDSSSELESRDSGIVELDDFQGFDVRSVPVDRIVGSIVSAVLITGATVGLCFLYFAVGLGILFYCLSGVAVAVACLLLYLAVFWPAIEHRNRAWRLTDVGLEVKHGVWWKHQQAIPWARVQHADVSQGPLQRMYGIGTLTVHTAGTKDSSVNLEGLAHETAVQLRDEVIRQRKSSDVV